MQEHHGNPIRVAALFPIHDVAPIDEKLPLLIRLYGGEKLLARHYYSAV
jgi:hypothetical protein